MPFVPDQPTPGFKPDAPTSGFKPDAPSPSFGSKLSDFLTGKSLSQKQDAEASLEHQQSISKYGSDAGIKQAYMKELPAGLAAGASTLLPIPGSALGRMAMNTAVGGTVGALSPANSMLDRIGNAGKSALASFLLSGAGEGISSLANKGADTLMKKAVGIRKAPEGLGNRLVDEGLMGTKSHMLGQAEDKLAEHENELQSLVKDLSGGVDAKTLGDAVAAKGNKFVSPSGITLNGVQNDLDKVTQAAGQFDPSRVGAQGPTQSLSPSDLLSLKRQGDWMGYTASGNPGSATDAEIGRAVADKSRSLLSEMSGGETADTLAKEQALIYAKKALDRDPTTHMGIGSSLFFGKVPGQDILGSLGAQGLQKGVAKPASLFSNPLVNQQITKKVSE